MSKAKRVEHKHLALIAEDTEYFLEVLKSRCEIMGIEWIAASSVAEALELARRYPICLALIDQGLPVRKGLKAVLHDAGRELIRLLVEQNPGLAIIGVTGQVGEVGWELRDEAIKVGALAFARKNRDYDGLERLIREVLAKAYPDGCPHAGRSGRATAKAEKGRKRVASTAPEVPTLILDGTYEDQAAKVIWDGREGMIQEHPFRILCALSIDAKRGGSGVMASKLPKQKGTSTHYLVPRLRRELARVTDLPLSVFEQWIKANRGVGTYRLLLPPDNVLFRRETLKVTFSHVLTLLDAEK